MISHFTGGNTMQPPEPVLSAAEFFIRRARRSLGIFPDAPACPIPALTEAQARRVLLFQQRTESHRLSRRLVIAPWPFPLFDATPSQFCGDADLERRCHRARARLMEAVSGDL